jgi:hypothetical protein
MSNTDYLAPDRANHTPVSQAQPLPVTLAPFSAVYAPASATVVAAGTGFVPADTILVRGSDTVRDTTLTVTHTKAITAAVVAGGTGGTPGAVTITGTTGTGTKFQATGTITAGGILSGALTVTVAGDYTVNPSSIAVEPVTGGSLTGCTVILTMGVLTATVTTPGVLSASSSSVSEVSSSGSGTGATFTLTATEIPAAGSGGSALIAEPTDRSSTITAGGTAQVLMAANTVRTGWAIQNQSSGALYVRAGATAVADKTAWLIPAGGYYEPPYISRAAISIIGATTSQAFKAEEW